MFTSTTKTLLILLLFISMIFGCSQGKDKKEINNDGIIDIYFNSNKRSYLEIIKIQRIHSEIYINFHYADMQKSYPGIEGENEIIVELENGNQYHLYKNGNELRVYEVILEGYQPEDIEWTFYKDKTANLEDL